MFVKLHLFEWVSQIMWPSCLMSNCLAAACVAALCVRLRLPLVNRPVLATLTLNSRGQLQSSSDSVRRSLRVGSARSTVWT